MFACFQAPWGGGLGLFLVPSTPSPQLLRVFVQVSPWLRWGNEEQV